ncbi:MULTISPECIES: HIT family protein [Pandoraea]|uniref:AP-4-A phosphorylase n=1 Tax=Pandoraea pneumonica TaxID=2508299 RepID=A0A5E4RHT8_9BURK|nr:MULTISPECIES: HIT family protein [Pandoraea]VVD62423.1 AP-4-A phosphorylase [Pandoraea pneumonica]
MTTVQTISMVGLALCVMYIVNLVRDSYRKEEASRTTRLRSGVMRTNDSECPFCFDDGKAVFRRAHARVIYDINPVTTGHMLILSTRHVSSYFDLSEDEKRAMWDLVDEVKVFLDKQFEPDGYNVGVNIGGASGQTIPHVHIHVIPRYVGDTPWPQGGVRGVIPERQSYE